MNLTLSQGTLSASSIFKLVAVGYLCGATILLGVFALVMFIIQSPIHGYQTEPNNWWFIALPLGLVAQALFVSGITVAGLWVFRRFRPIKVVHADGSAL